MIRQLKKNGTHYDIVANKLDTTEPHLLDMRVIRQEFSNKIDADNAAQTIDVMFATGITTYVKTGIIQSVTYPINGNCYIVIWSPTDIASV